MSKGWVKSHRKMMGWEWYKYPEMFLLFHHLLYRANHEDGEWRGLPVKRGQLITGRRKLEKETGLSQRTIRTCLERLKSTQELTLEPTRTHTLITICKYDEYQGSAEDDDPATDPDSRRDSTTNKKKRNTNTKRATKFNPQKSITVDEYQEILNDPDLASGNRDWLKRQVRMMANHFDGSTKKNWKRTLENWCLNARNKYNDPPYPKKGKRNGKATTEELNQQLIDEVMR